MTIISSASTTHLAVDINTVLSDVNQYLRVMDDWARAGWIRWLDAEFAVFLHRQVPDAPVPLLLAAALTSHQNGHGHVCLDIEHCLAEPGKALSLPPESPVHQPAVTPQQLLAHITTEIWAQALRSPELIGAQLIGESPSAGPLDDTNNQPLVLDRSSGRPLLYLRRFWQYEQTLSRSIQRRLASPPVIDDELLTATITNVFNRISHKQLAAETSSSTTAQCDWQKIACALAMGNRFAIITGGPGTGKTTTVVKLLAILQDMHKKTSSQPLRIRLAAPTGKAAARLSVSITSQLAEHNLPGIPGDVSTVHRLLGPIRHSRFFKHHVGNPLPVDVVVIDEASMVDIEQMALLLNALPEHARLILLGDKDQLASVEAGAVLGSLCQRAAQAHYTQQTADWITSVSGQVVPAQLIDNNGTPLDQAVTMLRYSHRFGAIPGIGNLAQAVNISASADTLDGCFDGRYNELNRIRIRSTQDKTFEHLIRDSEAGYGYYLRQVKQPPATDVDASAWDAWAKCVLDAHSHFQLLAALRKGEFGVEGLNTRIEVILRGAGLLTSWHDSARENKTPRPSSQAYSNWYPGRPVMVTRNDYNLDLMNGDIGITLPYPTSVPGGADFILRVAFPTADKHSPVRWVLPSRLQSVETVFAMTVHKSQGSEFVHTALILPHHENPVLTRELIYTGITRASRQFTLIDDAPNVLNQAVASSVFRASGLLHSINNA